MTFDTSRSQRRAADVLGIGYSVNDSYQTLALQLEAAGAPADGIPTPCENWRQAAKLSDDQLRAALKNHAATMRHADENKYVEY